MPPKIKITTPQVFIVIAGDEVDSVHATAAAAGQRAGDLDAEKVAVVKKPLQGGTITVSATTEAAENGSAPSTSKEEQPEKIKKAAAPAKPKTKSPAEQRAANANKSGKPSDEDLTENVKTLLSGSGNALDGLTIVVTGVPPTLGRKNAEILVEAYGGHLSKSLSKKTDYVLVGNDAGPVKLEKIAQMELKTLDEDGLVALIENGGGAGGGGSKRAADADDTVSEEERKPAKAKKQKK